MLRTASRSWNARPLHDRGRGLVRLRAARAGAGTPAPGGARAESTQAESASILAHVATMAFDASLTDDATSRCLRREAPAGSARS